MLEPVRSERFGRPIPHSAATARCPATDVLLLLLLSGARAPAVVMVTSTWPRPPHDHAANGAGAQPTPLQHHLLASALLQSRVSRRCPHRTCHTRVRACVINYQRIGVSVAIGVQKRRKSVTPATTNPKILTITLTQLTQPYKPQPLALPAMGHCSTCPLDF